MTSTSDLAKQLKERFLALKVRCKAALATAENNSNSIGEDLGSK